VWWFIPAIPATQEAEIRRITEANPGKKLLRARIMAYAYNPSYMGSVGRRITT
jgi:hypothetical protein